MTEYVADTTNTPNQKLDEIFGDLIDVLGPIETKYMFDGQVSEEELRKLVDVFNKANALAGGVKTVLYNDPSLIIDTVNHFIKDLQDKEYYKVGIIIADA